MPEPTTYQSDELVFARLHFSGVAADTMGVRRGGQFPWQGLGDPQSPDLRYLTTSEIERSQAARGSLVANWAAAVPVDADTVEFSQTVRYGRV